MAKYEFTNAAGNRLVEWCLVYNKEHTLGCIPYERLEKALWDEGYHSDYAVEKFVTWLRANMDSSSSAAKVLGLVADGMATELIRNAEFIGKVQAGFDAMTRRFGVSKEDITGGNDD